MRIRLQPGAALALAGLLCTFLVGCGDGQVAKEQPTTKSPGTEPMPAAETKQVVIDNFSFSPRELTVPVGTKVVWVNHDDVPHTATSTVKPRAFDSGTLDTDGQFGFVFTKPGKYEYFCAVHPKMTGQIIVK
jgi:plastocyanin